MRTQTLSEAAAEILKGSVSKAPSEGMHKQEGSDSVQNLGGDTQKKVADKNPDASVGTSKAAEPGAKPPVGKDEKKDLKKRNPEVETDTQARGTNNKEVEDDADKADLDPSSVSDLNSVIHREETEKDEEEVVTDEADGEELELEVEEEVVFDKEAIAKELQEQLTADLGNLLEGDELSTEFKDKAKLVFETAVLARVNVIVDLMEQKFTQELETAVEAIKEDLSEKTNNYLDYVAEKWLQENEIAIESSLRSELTEDFIAGLKQLFVEHYIDIPEDKVDVVAELNKEVEEKESKLSEEIKRNVDLVEKIKSYQKAETLAAVCEGLTDVQKDKMKSLAEGVEFTAEGDYKEKLNLLRDNYFTEAKKAETKEDGGLNEPQEIVEEADKKPVSIDPAVDKMASALSRFAQ